MQKWDCIEEHLGQIEYGILIIEIRKIFHTNLLEEVTIMKFILFPDILGG